MRGVDPRRGDWGCSVAAATRPRLPELRRSFASLRWQTPLSLEEFLKDVDRAAQDGFGIDLDHWTRGVHAVGAAVLERRGMPKLAIGGLAIAGQLSLDELRRLGGELRDTARLVHWVFALRCHIVSFVQRVLPVNADQSSVLLHLP